MEHNFLAFANFIVKYEDIHYITKTSDDQAEVILKDGTVLETGNSYELVVQTMFESESITEKTEEEDSSDQAPAAGSNELTKNGFGRTLFDDLERVKNEYNQKIISEEMFFEKVGDVYKKSLERKPKLQKELIEELEKLRASFFEEKL